MCADDGNNALGQHYHRTAAHLAAEAELVVALLAIVTSSAAAPASSQTTGKSTPNRVPDQRWQKSQGNRQI
ncbi:hypothetical protein ACFRI7_38045 [Streptomyces sp. NPDC056716]|uniref:hypothetical protein n=1 Tax=unclassified Streptomyces TaxID=2593676 RepID=UPI00369E296F